MASNSDFIWVSVTRDTNELMAVGPTRSSVRALRGKNEDIFRAPIDSTSTSSSYTVYGALENGRVVDVNFTKNGLRSAGYNNKDITPIHFTEMESERVTSGIRDWIRTNELSN